MGAIQYAGTFVGMVIAMSTCGVLSEVFGWESVFYVYGAIGCVWYLFWVILIKESPEKDPYISDEERNYILASLKRTKSVTTPQSVPWKSIFTSTAVWAIAASHFAENWGVYTMLTQLPLFFKRKKFFFHILKISKIPRNFQSFLNFIVYQNLFFIQFFSSQTTLSSI